MKGEVFTKSFFILFSLSFPPPYFKLWLKMKKSVVDKRKYKGEPLINKIPSQSTQDNIPNEEKLRLIDQTGLLKKVKIREQELIKQKQHVTTTSEYIWQAIFLSIPFGFLLATFDVTVKVQYSEPWNYAGLVVKCAKSAPGKKKKGSSAWQRIPWQRILKKWPT